MSVCRCARCGSLHEGTPADFNYCANCGGEGKPIEHGHSPVTASPIKCFMVERKNDEFFASLEVGAMWFQEIEGMWDNETPHLVVVTPGGYWDIDSRASNCTMKDDRIHRCWIRHGVPPNVTVDKNGVTCNAGAGSIQAGSWHGYIRNGELVQ